MVRAAACQERRGLHIHCGQRVSIHPRGGMSDIGDWASISRIGSHLLVENFIIITACLDESS